MNRENERTYWNLQERKISAEKRFADAISSIKNFINSSLHTARQFFSVAGEDGARDVLMSGSAIASANENHLLARLEPMEAVQVFQVIGALRQGQAPPSGLPQKIVLLGQLIAIGHQLSGLEESPHDIASQFDLQIQPDGSVNVEELPEEEGEPIEEIPEDPVE